MQDMNHAQTHHDSNICRTKCPSFEKVVTCTQIKMERAKLEGFWHRPLAAAVVFINGCMDKKN
jgi:hypothetical protein